MIARLTFGENHAQSMRYELSLLNFFFKHGLRHSADARAQLYFLYQRSLDGVIPEDAAPPCSSLERGPGAGRLFSVRVISVIASRGERRRGARSTSTCWSFELNFPCTTSPCLLLLNWLSLLVFFSFST